MGGSTGDASVATYNLESISNKNAFDDCEFCERRTIISSPLPRKSEITYRTKHVEQVLEVGQGVNEFVEHTRKRVVQRVVEDGRQLEVDRELLILMRDVRELVRDALLNVPEVLYDTLNFVIILMGSGRDGQCAPSLYSSESVSALCTKTSRFISGLS